MRKMTYLSPTSLKLYLEDKSQFYLQYLADNRLERPPQTVPMAVGSSFDAFCKSHLYSAIIGKKDPKFELMAIFEAQVQPQCRDLAYKDGEYCFNEYKRTGALADMMLELQKSVTEPRFEFDIMGQVNGFKEGVTREIGAVPFLGKPDVAFTNDQGARVVYDWKVNGFYSAYAKSPMKGYIRCRDSKTNYGQHKECFPQLWKGIKINIGSYMEQLDQDWARQLGIYSWLLGEEVGTDKCIVGIDQICCSPDTVRMRPKIKVAEHRLRIGSDFQFAIFAKAQEAWEIINSDWFFRDLPREVSQERCALLDQTVQALQDPKDENDAWLKRMMTR